MEKFIIQANEYLSKDTAAFYHSEYRGGGNWRIDGTIENIITTLKNDITPYDNETLKTAMERLAVILISDLPQILEIIEKKTITICVVPRAKKEDYYNEKQKLFRKTVSYVIENYLNNFEIEDGTKHIIRHTNTRTTHRNRSGHGGDGEMPYPGITKETCDISNNVRGKDILLIDDVYTKSINIVEDAIQALMDKGARSVYFYAVGKTVVNGLWG